MMHTMKTLSHSGCRVEAVDANYVQKSADTPAAAARLERQMNKQLAFRQYNRLPEFGAPAVIGHGRPARELFYFEMGRCWDKTALQFLADAPDARAVVGLARQLCSVVEQDLAASPVQEVSREVVFEKFNRVQGEIISRRIRIDESLMGEIERRVHALPEVMRLPVGRCHGDLTLANLFVRHDGSHVTLIDFLDTFIESPLLDVCKLRQDTRFLWTLGLHETEDEYVPAVKLRAALRQMDAVVVERFARYEWYGHYYKTFQLLNLFRILPYVTHPRTAAHVTGALAGLLIEKR